VCAGYTGGNCNVATSSAYGRYPVVQPIPTISSLISSTGTSGLPYTIGDGSPSGFIDIYSGSSTPYLYVVSDYVTPSTKNPAGPESSELVISRALLNGGTAQLSFNQWANGSFSLDGIGASSAPSAIGFLPGPETPFESCEGTNQIETGGSISFVAATGQYLLTFDCISRGGDPANGMGGPGAAWFFATNSDLTQEDNWSQPLEIGNSWDPFVSSCDSYNGWYPSLMSLDMSAGELGLDGYSFYLNGCRGDPTAGMGRTFESAYFTIDTSATIAVPEPATLALFGAGVLGLGAVRRRRKSKV
jgi:hypothetical protein